MAAASDPAAIFRSHFADIKDSIAARLDKALDEFYTASLIPQVLYDDVMSMGGPNSGKAARITQELQRKIRDSPNPSERLEEVCQILLKLEDEKLNRIVEDIRSKTGRSTQGVPQPEGYSRPGPTYPPGPAQGELNINHMKPILKVLKEAMFGAANWQDLGLSLGLYITTLDVIGKTNGNADDYLRMTIQKWLEKKDGVKGTTWQILIDAVESEDRAAAQRMPDIIRSIKL